MVLIHSLRKNQLNITADYPITIMALMELQYSKSVKNKFKQIARLQKEDEKLNKLRDSVEKYGSRYHTIKEYILFERSKANKQNWRVMIPNSLTTDLITDTHEI